MKQHSVRHLHMGCGESLTGMPPLRVQIKKLSPMAKSFKGKHQHSLPKSESKKG